MKKLIQLGATFIQMKKSALLVVWGDISLSKSTASVCGLGEFGVRSLMAVQL